MGVVVGMITVGAMATEMVATKESCISQQHNHTLTHCVVSSVVQFSAYLAFVFNYLWRF